MLGTTFLVLNFSAIGNVKRFSGGASNWTVTPPAWTMVRTMTQALSAPLALRIGDFTLNSPVILAPMAGVTNMPFRVLCREIEQELTGTSSGLYVCEMITARALVARNQKTLHMTTFADVEIPRSMQLYTVDPKFTYEAVRMIVEEDIADHVDMNFGCPVPKVTRKGGGSALPYKRRLYANIVAAAVRAAEGSGIPITVKFRIGICLLYTSPSPRD